MTADRWWLVVGLALAGCGGAEGASEEGPNADAGASAGAGAAPAGGTVGGGAAGGTGGGAASGGSAGTHGTGGSGGMNECGGAPDCGEDGAACCDPAPCDGMNFCHGALQCCNDNTCRPSCGGPIIIPECPGETIERCSSDRCLPDGTCLECPVGQVCVEVNLSCGPAGGSSAQCIDDPCSGQALDCSCASSVCDTLDEGLGGWTCGVFTQDHFLVGPNRDPFMTCSGGGPCASPETPIATPEGDKRIADLMPGDLIYSIHDSAIISVPLVAVARTRVTNHRVLRVILDDGAVLEVSGPHPMADGRRLDALAVGEEIDGRIVTSADFVDYEHPFTHDILPASESGAYRANGVWLGSTLADD